MYQIATNIEALNTAARVNAKSADLPASPFLTVIGERAYAEQISFAIATLHQIIVNPKELPHMGRFPVLHARFDDGKIIDGYMVTEREYLPGGFLIRLVRLADDRQFAGFFRLDTHRNGAMFTATN